MKRILVATLMLACGTAAASTGGGFGLAVLVDDEARPEYAARGNVYVEAIRGLNYSLRLSNPTPYRVAVALSVDGLNTINARHTDPLNAAKWILEPYDSMVISGWQVNDRNARRFFFTGEKNSYGAALGQIENLGVIEAVFYRQRQRNVSVFSPRAQESSKQAAPSAAGAAPSDDYAGTGMGGRTRHDVELVDIELEKNPAATVRIRYEFRSQLVSLGVLPPLESPLDRRERARGFGNYCPEPR
jgi:hypothetical protein